MHQIVEFSKDVLGVDLYPGQIEALNAYYEGNKPNWLLLSGRRGGKSLLSDIVACYEAIIPSFGAILRPGEDRYIIVVSVRQDNANLHTRQIGKLLKHTKAIGQMITEQTRDRIALSNGVVILSLPASARAGRGFTVSTLILDELAHFVDTAGNQSGDSVFEAFTPTLATFGNMGRVVITTTPMSRTGIVYDLYDRAIKNELDDWFVSKYTTQQLNPKVGQRVIDRAMNRDSQSAQTEYFAEFADPVAAYLDGEAIERAIDRSRVEAITGEANQNYVMAIDPATMADRYAYAIAHREDDRIILDYCNIIKPPVDPNAAEELLFDLVRRFKPIKIRCDTAATVNRLKGQLDRLEYTPFTRPMKLRIYGNLKEPLNLGNLVLYRHDDLIDELKALQIRNGVDISAPKAGRIKHDDLTDCLALCCDALINKPGEACFAPNFLYEEWPENSKLVKTGNEFVWVKEGTVKHREGITWRNCRKRNSGCEACVSELSFEGFFDEPYNKGEQS